MTESPTVADARTGPTVFVDAEPFSWKWFAGVPRYAARLVMALAERCPVRFFDGDHEIEVGDLSFDQGQDLEVWARRVWNAPRIPLPTDRDAFTGLYPGFRFTPRRFGFEIGVLHDLCPLLVTKTFPEDARPGFRRFFSREVLHYDAMIAVSHSTKADAAWLCPLPPDRIHVAHSGPSLCVGERHHHSESVIRMPKIGLVVSTVEPRKNAPFLLNWFHNSEALPPDMELWWVGKTGWLTTAEQLDELSRGPRGRRVRFLGNVPDARLCELYRQAGWSIYASLYEGFGFPVVDSLMHGTPVLTSYNSSLREFDHPGVRFFDPCDPATVDEAWSDLNKIECELIPRADLSDLYDWSKVARLVRGLAVERDGRTTRLHGAESPRPRVSIRSK